MSKVFWKSERQAWCFKFKDPQTFKWRNKQCPVDLQDEEVAQRWADDWVSKSGIVSSSGAKTLRTLGAAWVSMLQRTKGKAEAESRKGTLERYLYVHPIASIDVEKKLDVAACVTWIEWLNEQRSKRTKKRLAALTVRNIIQCVRDLIVDARGRGWCPGLKENPLADPYLRKVFRKPERKAGEDPVVLDDAQAHALVTPHRHVPPYRTVRYALGIFSGLRLAEIQGLSWSHLVLEGPHPRIQVERQIVSVDDEGTPTFKPPKRGSKRWVPIHQKLLALLLDWRDFGFQQHSLRPPKPDDPVVPDPLGGYGRQVAAGRFIKEDLAVQRQPAVDSRDNPIDFHSTRRTFATALSDVGTPDGTLKALMGHAAGNVTDKAYVARNHKRYAPWVERILQPAATPIAMAAE